MSDSARVGVAIAGLAVAGVSDMPDFTRDRFSWEGSCWELVSDPDLDTALVRPGGSASAQEAFAARLANILRLNVGNLVVTEGANINHLVALAIAGATAEFQQAFIQNLRTNGAEIDVAVIAELASNLITSGKLRTAASGQRWEITSQGIVMYAADPDQGETEVVRLGPAEGDNLITIGGTTVSPTAVSTADLSAETLTVGGDSLDDTLATLPRGLIAYARSTSVGQWDSGDAQWRLQVNTYTYPDRMYRVRVNAHYVQTRSALPGVVTEFLRWKDITDGVGVSSSSPQIASLVHSLPRAGAYSVPGIEGLVDGATIGSNPDGTRTQFVLSAQAPQGDDVRYVSAEGYPFTLTIEDVGPSLAATGRSWVHVGNPTVSQGPAPAPTPEPERSTRRTQTWVPQGYGGDVSSGEIVQGYISSGVPPMRSGSWTMPGDMRAALQGSKIEKLEIYLYATHWYYSGGGTASIRATDGTGFKAFVGSAFTSANWPRSAGRWVAVPSSWFPYFQSGAWKGIGVQTGSTSQTYYGRFRANATKFRATYTR